MRIASFDPITCPEDFVPAIVNAVATPALAAALLKRNVRLDNGFAIRMEFSII
jgi:hypothetical protein